MRSHFSRFLNTFSVGVNFYQHVLQHPCEFRLTIAKWPYTINVFPRFLGFCTFFHMHFIKKILSIYSRYFCDALQNIF